ncbi:MAG: YchJ family metal-binding protein [Alteromonadaceae bacterium]|jgi:SEC-C motif-containing protein
MKCPCGSNTSFKQCCLLVITEEVKAISPEQLMRSRYSAYATKSADYIYNTYANSSREHQSVNDIFEWAQETKWLKLIIHSASEYSAVIDNSSDDLVIEEYNLPTVFFSAYYKHQSHYYLMKETSRFILEGRKWRYLDGEVSSSKELAAPKRNELCFCKSQKKFKQCCGS